MNCFEYEDTDETKYVIFCSIDIYGIPSYLDEDEPESLYDDPKQSEQIGSITVFLVLFEEMQNRDIDIPVKCVKLHGLFLTTKSITGGYYYDK